MVALCVKLNNRPTTGWSGIDDVCREVHLKPLRPNRLSRKIKQHNAKNMQNSLDKLNQKNREEVKPEIGPPKSGRVAHPEI